MRFRRILVGVDLALAGDRVTFGSARAVEQALRLARPSGAEIVFVHSTWADMHEEDQAIRPGPSAEGTHVLEGLVAEAAASSVRARLELVRERAWLELIRAVQRGEGDLVIVGRHNQEAGGAAMGGMARKLLRKCPCPVWIVRPEGRADLGTVVAATDLTAVGNRAVELGGELAATGGGTLHVVHAWPLPVRLPVLPELEPPVETRLELQALESSARERLETALRSMHLPVEPRTHLSCGAASVVIRESVARLDADLLVMGTVSRGGIAGLLLGNTAERLLDRVSCSLLTIKPRDFVSPVSAPPAGNVA